MRKSLWKKQKKIVRLKRNKWTCTKKENNVERKNRKRSSRHGKTRGWARSEEGREKKGGGEDR